MITKYSLPFLLTLSVLSAVRSQPITFTAEDARFFEKRAQEYETWLDQTGLGAALAVQKQRLKKDSTELELLLRLRASDLDSAIALWSRAQNDYKAAGGEPLEEALFRTFFHKMEIPPRQGNVQVYVLDKDGIYIPCFYVFIWEENGSIRTESRIRECRTKDKPIDIQLQPLRLRKTAKGKTTELKHQRNSAQVFDSIEAFMKEKFTRTNCYDRRPVFDLELRTETILRISLSDLCRVVLTDEQKSIWCRTAEALGWNCNDMRRERLEFEFTFLSGSTYLGGRLSGKFGSGVYRPRKEAYLDMEPDFNSYLDDFHRKFQQELKAYLEKP